MVTVPYDSSAEGPLSGLCTDAACADKEECELLAWGLVIGPGDGVVIVDRGVSARGDHIAEGVGDNDIIDPSCEDDRVGTTSGGRDGRFGCGVSTACGPLCP